MNCTDLRVVAGLSQPEQRMEDVVERLPVEVSECDVITVLGQPCPCVLGALCVQLPVEVLLNTTELHPVDLTHTK